MRAIVVQHEKFLGPGLLAPLLKAAGYSIESRFRDVRYEDTAAELVVVLGGTMSVEQAEEHPFLGHELSLLAERLASDRPTLGIGLGAQLLARAAGADVFSGKNGIEVGVAPVRWTKAGLEDPVFVGVRPKTTVAHWHSDTFTPVPEAVLLASTDRYTQQAFRLGRSYGFQFHVELNGEELGRIYDEAGEELIARGKDLTALKAELPKLKSSEAERTALCERLVHALRQR
ncbi:MAG: type 1 glutamine amidotransferase [Myxococcaceae bacterium]